MTVYILIDSLAFDAPLTQIGTVNFRAFPLAHWMIFACLAAAGCAAQRPPTCPRQIQNLNADWKFFRADAPNADHPNFDDSHWPAINLPHTWNGIDGQDGGNHYYRGPGWYRKHLQLTSQDLSKKIYLRIDGACLVSDIFINGQHAGTHRGAFAAFCFDITPMLHPGDNLLAIRVDNSFSKDIPPLSGDFTMYGGLYRDVNLLTLNPLHISPLDDASPGLYLTPTHIDDNTAQIHATAKLQNDFDQPQTFDIYFQIKDSTGSRLIGSLFPQSLAAHSSADVSADLTIGHPHLWNGKPDPYLYQASVEILQSNKILDQVTQPLGLRYFRVDPNQGFFLNGHPYPLHGVGIQQDYPKKGWAISPADIDQDFQLIDEIGANTLRLSHHQYPDFEYSQCDQKGYVVWAELALVNRITDTNAFSENAKQQLRELIKQNYNHPSIFFWGIYNELGPHTRSNWTLVTQLNDLAHTLDAHRLTTCATHMIIPMPFNFTTDLTGANRYWGWYTTKITDWPTQLDKLHAAHPKNSIAISEFGAGASIFQHQNNLTTEPQWKSHWHPEEWQQTFHEAAYNAIKNRPWIWTSYVWSMFDFYADERDEGDHPGYNDKGLVTTNRQTKKDAFYFFKANWSEKPFVHITEQRLNPRPIGPTQIKIYSNCDTVDLWLDQKDQGQKTSLDHIFIWNQIQLTQGIHQAQAIAQKAGKNFTDECQWIASRNVTTHPTTNPENSPTTTQPAIPGGVQF
jgi:beta-galactosidase